MKRRGKAVPNVMLNETILNCRYNDEAQLRSGIARIADAYGWFVEEEVVVPGWGRIDLVLRSDPLTRPILIELKVDLTKPSDVRKGYQQVDGYSRWWAKTKGETNAPILSAVKAGDALIDSIGDAYPTVAYRNAYTVLKGLRNWEPTDTRVARARGRRADRQRELNINEHACRFLGADLDAKQVAAEAAAAVKAADAIESQEADAE